MTVSFNSLFVPLDAVEAKNKTINNIHRRPPTNAALECLRKIDKAIENNLFATFCSNEMDFREIEGLRSKGYDVKVSDGPHGVYVSWW